MPDRMLETVLVTGLGQAWALHLDVHQTADAQRSTHVTIWANAEGDVCCI